MTDGVVTTGVDDLLDLLRQIEKISMMEASEKLHVPLETLQSWVDFLVEEKIIGLEYKFTKPFIYLNREDVMKKKEYQKETMPKLKELKKEYAQRAKAKQIPHEQIGQLWDAHVRQELSNLEQYFFEQAQRRGVQDTKVRKQLWDDYSKELIKRIEEA